MLVLLALLFRASPARALVARVAAVFGERADVLAAFLAKLRFALDFDDLAFRALAPAFDFFELFLRDDIRGSLPASFRFGAEHATGDAIRGIASTRPSIGNHPLCGASSLAQISQG